MKSKESPKFICLVYFDVKKLHSMPELEKKAFDASSQAYDQALQRSGNYVIAEALHSPTAARTVAVRGKKVTVKDGPFVAAAEPLLGFILIRAQNMAKA